MKPEAAVSILSLSPPFVADLLRRAAVPEHSVLFMETMSGGSAFCEDGFLFLAGDDWLMGVGYPFTGAAGEGDPEWGGNALDAAGHKALAVTFGAALDKAMARTGAVSCWAAAPRLPDSLQDAVAERDVVYMLEADAAVPAPLRGKIRAAGGRLRVTEDREFTPEHRRLWAEFLGRVSMRPNVRELYARTEAALAMSRALSGGGGNGGRTGRGGPAEDLERPLLDLRLLSAWDDQGRLAASLLLDYSPGEFCSYIIGAHSRRHYTPHATDLLFAAMLESCRREGKRHIHLGLGVNEGIARFKRKWGGRAVLPYEMAAWTAQARKGVSRTEREIVMAMRELLDSPGELSKRQIFENLPRQRPFAMIREVRKGNAVSYLCGTAHFFCYSFSMAFQELFKPLHTIIFEGPLDEGFLGAVEKHGRGPEPGSPRAVDLLDEEDIRRLEGVVNGPRGFWPRLFGCERPHCTDVRALLAGTRPWFAFFSLWAAYLEGQGWDRSVDLEAWHTAKDMGKAVIGMESLEEQIASLEVIPLARITDFLRRGRLWPAYMKRNIRAYLAGDLQRMMGSSTEFPSRTEQVIDRRDERFRQRMRPFLEAGDCAVFVGTAHLVGLRPMLERDGFTVRPVYPAASLKARALARRLLGGTREENISRVK